jgi:hypothetical protein
VKQTPITYADNHCGNENRTLSSLETVRFFVPFAGAAPWWFCAGVKVSARGFPQPQGNGKRHLNTVVD